MKISTFGFLTQRGVRNLGKHWAMTIACIASLSVCMTLNIFASLIEVNVDSMVSYLGSQNEMVVYVDPEADDATIQSVGNALSGTAGVSRVQYMSKEDVLNQYKGYMSDYAALLNVSPKTLTLYVNECSKYTPLELINDRIILEAKRLLRYSVLSVKEIAFRLGFDDPSYFGKFFKRLVKQSPADYRESF